MVSPELGNHVARFSFAYSDIPVSTPAFVARPIEDDDLGFDPKTLEKKPAKSVPQTIEEPVDEKLQEERAQSIFSMGN